MDNKKSKLQLISLQQQQKEKNDTLKHCVWSEQQL